MSEIYRVPPWIMLEYWELKFTPDDKPNTFTITILDKDNVTYQGKGVSISHAAKNAYKKRQKTLKDNETGLPSEGSTLPSESTTAENQSTETV